MKSFVSVAAVVASVGLSSVASAALVYGGGTQTGSRFNPGGTGTITYMNCFAATNNGETQLQLSDLAVGIRRIASGGALVDVGVNIYVAELTYDGTNVGIGASQMVYSTASLGGGSASVTQSVSTGALKGVVLNLETTALTGFGGFWVGVEFTGANGGNVANGWRVIGAPTTGSSVNGFGMFNYQGNGSFDAFYTLGAGVDSRMMVDVNGTLVPAPGALALLGLAGVAGSRRRR
jgi:hypothetical protein